MKVAIVKWSALTTWDPARYLNADPNGAAEAAEKKVERAEARLKKAKSERAAARREKRKTQRKLDKMKEAGDIILMEKTDGQG